MATQPYIVIRLVPESAVDAATFTTYLDGLQLQVLDANTGAPLSDYVYYSPLNLFPSGTGYASIVSAPTWSATPYDTTLKNYGSTLTFDSTDGIPLGSFVFSADFASPSPTINPSANLSVVESTLENTTSPGTIQLNSPLQGYVPAGTVVYFVGLSPTENPSSAPAFSFSLSTIAAATTQDGVSPPTTADPLLVLHFADATGVTVGMGVSGSAEVGAGTTVAQVLAPTGPTPTEVVVSQPLLGSPSSVTFSLEPPVAYFSLTPTSGTPSANPTVLNFPAGKTQGVAVGMILVPINNLVARGTEVIQVTDTSVTLSKALQEALPAAQSLTFTFPLTSGIVQHTEVETESVGFGSISFNIPASVATAVIPLNPSPPLPPYLDIKLSAMRGSEVIPLDQTYYNVIVSTDALPSPDQYQSIATSETSLYLALPPQPGTSPIPLVIPTDGSPPPFDAIYQAVQTALTNDPITGFTAANLITSPDNCSRIAYDIAWSYQNTLPAPPDPLESLYSNPPNPGGSSAGTNTQNNLEQDRIKFEGTLDGYYATRNALAERLTKFVAAASAAIYCEQTSLNSTAALLEFPVDPGPIFAGAVMSEILLTNLGGSGPGDVNFGVPAAFFYALGANLDKGTSGAQRFQIATGDAAERLVQQFEAAINSGVITDSHPFSSTGLTHQSITSFQAVRRLVALGVGAESTTPSVAPTAGSALAALVNAWLLQVDPTSSSPPNPPPTYASTDFGLWTAGLAATNQQGYLELDLADLTQAYSIPPSVLYPSVSPSTGSLVTFEGVGIGIGVGMSVSGTGVSPGTTVTKVEQIVTVALNSPVVAPGVSASTPITFQAGNAPITASPDIAVASGSSSMTFAASPASLAIVAGMRVSGTGIAAGTVVSLVTVSTNVTLSAPASGVTKTTKITFGTANAPANSLATQIETWLPSTASPPASLTVTTLKQVTAAQWLTFFSIVGGPSWLPPFTQPVAAGAAAGPSASPNNQNAGYVALRIRAFVRAVQQFFTVSSVATSAQLPAPGAAPVFDVLPFDPIGQAVAYLPSGFKFGTPLTAAELTNATQGVFPNDAGAQVWLTRALTAINELCEVTGGVTAPALTMGSLPSPVSYEFSLVEALYARGFQSAADITHLSGADFQQALIGTIAYDSAGVIYAKAQTLAPTLPAAAGTGETFQPINPDGSLVNCIPPPCLSPLGPIAYLHEMLQLSPSSTCAQPFAIATGQMTLGTAMAARRGSIGNLLATRANLETPLPLIDLVNECLEYLGAPAPPPAGRDNGTVYDTSADRLAGYLLCRRDECTHDDKSLCHDPAAIFDALPEYSTPATPVAASQSVEPQVYNNLKSDFSACNLPYSQALDVSRTYMRHLGSCRFEELRAFRKCITEFALDPANPPAGFQSYRYRFPTRIESAIEYLGITPEEYTLLYQGTAAQPCAAVSTGNPPVGNPNNPPGTPVGVSTNARPTPVAGGAPTAVNFFAGAAVGPNGETDQGSITLAEFLAGTCLTYCEFLELWKVVFLSGQSPNSTQQTAAFPECEPCCLSDYILPLPTGDGRSQALIQLAIFIRLWRKLRDVCGAGYSFAQLYDICTVLRLFSGGAVNPEFIRQLAAFQMLRDQFKLPLVDPSDKSTGTTGADRTHLLALWVGPNAKAWRWAVARLIEGVEHHARAHFGCTRPRGEAVAHMADNLDALSRLAGFNPSTSTTPSTDTWNSTPGCTLRFAEVLAKICASRFRLGEVLYLFNAAPPRDSENPFPGQEPEEALNHPLDLPEHEREHSLWRLREKLLRIEPHEGDSGDWNWPRLVAEFRARFGYAPTAGQDPLLSIGQHFFPRILEESGLSVSTAQRQYQATLTSSTAWNTPDSPFHYDSTTALLTVRLPLRDEAVSAALGQLPQLTALEEAAVQDLYFAPRADLAFLAWLFPDWQSAEIHLIEEHDEHRRWEYFRRHVALAHVRSKAIAEHLARHVAHRTGCAQEDLAEVADLVLGHLLADENTGIPWESDSGLPPSVMWTAQPSGGALAALLGLAGTGLLGEYAGEPAIQPGAAANGATVSPLLWREVRGPFKAFGHERDATNSPVPTVLPPLALTSTSNPLAPVSNGYGVRSSDGLRLGGAESFSVSWSGVLLVDLEGEYAFHAGAPTPEGQRPDFEHAEQSQWRVTLKRGQRSWTVLNHQWPGDTSPDRNMPRLRPGAYEIVIDYSQAAPDWSGMKLRPQKSGFEVKYAGPDSADCLVALPLSRLYRDFKDQTLDQGVQFLAGTKNAQAFLRAYYTSTLRDIRRTYQRAFKAVLFCARFQLTARRGGKHRLSELGYMLANPALFAGAAYYRTGSTFTQHLANFDFDFLPIQDNYDPPTPVPPDRATPSLQRTQAMFDWWERMFDYDWVRQEVHRSCTGPLWHLFSEANYDAPTNATALLRHIGAEPAWWDLDVRFYQDQTAPIYTVSTTDLRDERWLLRVWHADRWLRNLRQHFHAKDISTARPDLWAALDPSAPVPNPGGSLTGNANLLAFLTEGCFDNGEPRRYRDVKRLNDGLRERGRNALVSYLCANNRVALPWTSTLTYATTPQDLSDLLLMDVEIGVCEKASRIDEAITAVQTFVRRVRLGLESDWKIGREFAQLWDSRFDTYRTWERCKRRELYRENWIEWSEFGKARRIEAFRFLESRLSTSTLSLAAPGGMDWWADHDKDLEREPALLQRRIPSELHPLTPPPQSITREGFSTLGSADYAAEPTWLTPVPQGSAASDGTSGSAPDAVAVQAAPAATGAALVQAAAVGSAQPQNLPLWMESAMKLGTRFLRVAAAGIPEAAAPFAPRGHEGQYACCRECGCEHPVLVDEYYFWLTDTQFYAYTDQTDAQSNADASFVGSYQNGFQDSYYDAFQQQSAEWNEEDMVPPLLAKWLPTPAVRLNWCRLHNGEFGQPRCSSEYVAVADVADIIFLGRGADSLYFEISNPALPLPPGYSADPSPPGFRYDLRWDRAVALPEVAAPPASVSTYPGGLVCYPFFAYDDPGARLFPSAWFSPAMLVAQALRTDCRFELALNWYKRAFDPLRRDCAWMHCGETVGSATTTSAPSQEEIARRAYLIWEQHGRPAAEQTQDWMEAKAELQTPTAVAGGTVHEVAEGACCDSADVDDDKARNRAVTLAVCQTLCDWGDALMRRRHSPEAIQQARLLFDTAAKITGRRPRSVQMSEPKTAAPIVSFIPAFAPLNPRLLDLYDLVADRRALIHQCFDARRLRSGRLDRDVGYFGNSQLRDGWRETPDPCDDAWCMRPNPYRFTYQIQKSLERAARLREIGSSLQAAYEKLDASVLESMRAVQEREILALELAIRQDQWRDADWQVQALQQTKEVNQTNLIYYTNLYQNGLINDEIQNLSLATNAVQTRTCSNLTSAYGEAMVLIPDSYVGAMSTFEHIPLGTKLAGLFQAIAKVIETVADIQSETAAIDATQANWERRAAEWFNHMQTLPIEIQQTELLILGAHRRRDQSLRELNNHQRKIEHAAEVENFLRDKFTSTDLFLFLKNETAGLQREMYRLAFHSASEAQRAFNFELGHTTRNFLPEECQDTLRDTLMAGEHLEMALHRMAKAYEVENIREYELMKHFSLRLQFPEEFARLKETGVCEIELRESLYDQDYPGHYMRRIKSLSVTIPCVTGPYSGVHCRVTLLSSRTRIDPRLEAPPSKCCCDCDSEGGYEACPHDVRMVHTYGAREAIATSSGQNDSGLFDLNLQDLRYLPGEFHGAVARFRIDLRREDNYWPRETLTDFIFHLQHTAREGGEPLRRAAAEAARKRLPGSGWCLFDARQDFPDGWQQLRNSLHSRDGRGRLSVHFERKLFPYIPDGKEIAITQIAVLFGASGGACPPMEISDCACPVDRRPGAQMVEFLLGHRDWERASRVTCVASDEWAELYYGVCDLKMPRVGRHGERHEVTLRFSEHCRDIDRVFLLCRYERCCEPDPGAHLEPLEAPTARHSRGAPPLETTPTAKV